MPVAGLSSRRPTITSPSSLRLPRLLGSPRCSDSDRSSPHSLEASPANAGHSRIGVFMRMALPIVHLRVCRRRLAVALAVALLTSLAAAAAAAETFEFQVVGIECKLCAPPIQKALAAIPGVQKARVDWKKRS